MRKTSADTVMAMQGRWCFGVSVGATGFALGSAGVTRDYALFRRLIGLLLVQHSASVLLLVALLLVLRLLLIFVAPAWALWQIVSWAERRLTARLATQSSSTVPDKIA